mgnify:CR=1 FL=1
MINTVALFGRMTSDAEMRAVGNGLIIAKFSIAVHEQKKNKEEVTHFIDCTAFGKTAEIIRDYLGKGQPVLLQGRLNQESWESKDGIKKSRLGVIVEKLQLMTRQSSGAQESQNAKKSEKTPVRSKNTRSQINDFNEESQSDMPF